MHYPTGYSKNSNLNMIPGVPFCAWVLLVLIYSTVASPTVGRNGQKVTTEKGIEYVFEAPPMPANRILFIAHGCGHSALDFWPKSPQCLNCVGLPEERRIVTKALTRGYFVVAVSSAGQDHGGCWDVKVDAKKVMRVLSLIKKKHSNLRTAPIFALGASSGGHMVAALGSRLHDIGGL